MFRLRLVITTLLLLVTPFFALAQENSPLILWVRGDLYAVTDLSASPAPLTQNGTISGPVLSSDGQMLAYKAAAPVGLAALDRVQTSGFIADFDLPGDIYLLNLATQQTALVASQPADASLFVEGVPDNAVVRSTPAWSPDGTKLAWTEFAFGTEIPRLVIYDLPTRAQTVLADALPVGIVMGSAPGVRWGNGGIAIIGDAGEILIYGTDGTLLSAPEPVAEEGEAPQEYIWMDTNDQSLFGILYSSGRWALFDPATGAEQIVDGVPVLVGAGENLALRFGMLPDVGIFWETVDLSGVTSASGAFPAPPSRVTLSPTGEEAAFIGYPDYGGVAIWRNGEVFTVPGTGSDALAAGALLWGATSWQLGPAA
jgi:hypothetical protein